MKKQNSHRQVLKNRLDKNFSTWVRHRDGQCVICGSTSNLQCGHYLSRIFVHTRWHEKNAHAQCARCNRIHEQDPAPYTWYMIERYGDGVLMELSSLAHRPDKVPDEELARLDSIYREKAAEAKG